VFFPAQDVANGKRKKIITKTRNDESTKEEENEKGQSTNKCNAPKFNVRNVGNLSLGFDWTLGFSM